MMSTSGAIVGVSVLVAFTAFVGMSYRTKTLSAWEAHSVSGWSVSRLREFIESRGMRSDVYLERKELVGAVQKQILAERENEPFAGYTLLLVGYILFPALGIALVQRRHEQRNVGGGSSESAEDEAIDNIVYNPLPPSPFFQTRFWFERAELQSQVNGATSVILGKVSPSHEEENCIVCLANMTDGQKIRELKCKHRFHVSCCDAWLIYRRKNWCPLCMTPVIEGRDPNMNILVG
eukprot:Plantae.Rhodophyta-Purpureofilum_apyrenoidigerum.ctg828.p1 GENE.Plantae.Rhodophyta-Purpureofilum_apyrenoidigerum.ctg828~~Plantae.Rhodophyta-Purpureofilum_apyrenoidigerum.ctg828.p1  ORF type:complete len:235 (-),score=28.53 Plantae.Rhodophyta-Purpureofilum_apyrenoidigerum.ctg828:357-1061(-)